MTEQLKSENSSTSQQPESDVLVLIKRMHQQLIFLEKKIDMLINKSQEKPFREKHFSKPFRSFSRPYRPGQHHDKQDRGEDFEERGSRSGHHFEKHRGNEDQGFGGPKKHYSDDRESSPGQGHHFKNKFGGKKRGFGSGKKFFSHKRKDR